MIKIIERVPEKKTIKMIGITEARVDEDTVQLGHVLNEQRYNGLKSHAFIYSRHGGYDRALDKYKAKTKIDNYLDIPEDIMFEYATMDAIVTYQTWEAMQKQLTSIDERIPNEKTELWRMRDYYEKIMMPAVKAFCEIEFRGVYADVEKLEYGREKVRNEIEQVEAELAELWGVTTDFDFNSTQKLGTLFERLGWEDFGRSKAGLYQTGDDILQQWAALDRPGAKKMQRLRSLKALLKTFLSPSADADTGWAQYIRKHDEDDSFRLHPVFNVMRTESGRCRSDSPNMQNVPAHGDLAPYVKKVVSTPNNDEFYMCTVDYASLQIRLGAIDTNLNEGGRDENLYSVYTDPAMGGDMHSRTGFGVFAQNKEFELDIITVTKEDGTKVEYFAEEFVKTERGKIFAKDLVETDILL